MMDQLQLQLHCTCWWVQLPQCYQLGNLKKVEQAHDDDPLPPLPLALLVGKEVLVPQMMIQPPSSQLEELAHCHRPLVAMLAPELTGWQEVGWRKAAGQMWEA